MSSRQVAATLGILFVAFTEGNVLVRTAHANGSGNAAASSSFARLSQEAKLKFLAELHENPQWVTSPDRKDICRFIIETTANPNGQGLPYILEAIDLTEAEGWSDLAPFIEQIFERPRTPGSMERAFLYVRARNGKPVSPSIKAEAKVLEEAGGYRSTVTDERLYTAKQALMQESDKEAVLVYALLTGMDSPGKGGNNRGRFAAVDVLKALDRNIVEVRLRQLRQTFDSYLESRCEWLAQHLGISLDTSPRNRKIEGK